MYFMCSLSDFMKKFFPLLILCCLSLRGLAQPTATATVNSSGSAGSYTSGYTQAAGGRTDGNMVIGDASPITATRGYAVFNLASILPPGATVDSVYLRFNFSTSNATSTVRGEIHGYPGNLSSVASAATLFADCAHGHYFDSSAWGAAVSGAQDIISFNDSGVAFIQNNLGASISIGWITDTPGNTYTIVGEAGTSSTQPKLTIRYHCTGVSGTLAYITPNPVCAGSPFTLHAVGTGGATYSWTGPGSYTSASQNPPAPIIASSTTTGIYNYTVSNAAGCPTSEVAFVIMNPLPAPVTGDTAICAGASTSYADTTSGGYWSVRPSTLGSITGTGVYIAGMTSGHDTVVYTLSTGCSSVLPVHINPLPAAISGVTTLCSGVVSTLSDGSPSGTWSISPAGVATLSSTGVLTGGALTGTITASAVVTYTLPTGCYKTTPVNLLPLPAPIVGDTLLCAPTTTTLSDLYPGTWTSAPASIASVGSTTGIVTGHAYGSAIISFTNPYGCYVTSNMHVATTSPAAILGNASVCPILLDTLRDIVPGGYWSLGAAGATITSVNSFDTAVVLGLSAGVVPVTYTNGCGMAILSLNVLTPAASITGVNNTCIGQTVTLSDATTPGVWSGSSGVIATVTSGFGTVHGNTAGPVIITYTATSNSCIDTVHFLVNPLPLGITGTLHTCPGDTVELADLPAGGSWSSQNSSVATVNSSGVVTGVAATTTTISYTLPTGCYSTVSMLVNPNPAPITGIRPICETLYDTVADATLGGLWFSSSPGIVSVADSGTWGASLHGVGGGSSTITYRLPTGCIATAVEVVHPTPSPTITYTASSNTLYTQSYYATYQWYDAGLPITGATTFSVAGLTPGNYSVFVTDSFGCQVMSSIFPLTTAMGVGQVAVPASSVHIYPNPASGVVNIDAPVKVNVWVSAMDGRVLMQQENATSVDVSGLSTGVYMISLYDMQGNRITVEKLLKD